MCLHASSDRELTIYQDRPCQLCVAQIVRLLPYIGLKASPCIFHTCWVFLLSHSIVPCPHLLLYSGGFVFALLAADLWFLYHRSDLPSLAQGEAILFLILGIITRINTALNCLGLLGATSFPQADLGLTLTKAPSSSLYIFCLSP